MDSTLEPLHPRCEQSVAIPSLIAMVTTALIFCSGGAGAATAPIYKCSGPDRAPVYTDQPCKGGAVLDVHPGDVDAAAVERLQVARDMLDRSAAARLANEQRYAQDQELAIIMRRQQVDARIAAEADYSSTIPPDQYLSWYPGTPATVYPTPPHRPPPHRPAPRGFAPNPPFVVPRS
jgi:hypothetical protein